MDYLHSPDDLSPIYRAINHIFAFCEQTGRSLKNFLTSFEVCCAEAQLEFKPITSQKDLLVLFLSPAMQVEIQQSILCQLPLCFPSLLPTRSWFHYSIPYQDNCDGLQVQ